MDPNYGGFWKGGQKAWLLPPKRPWKDVSRWWGGNRREHLDPRDCLDIASISPLVKGLLVGREEYPMILKWAPSLSASPWAPTLFLVFGVQLWNHVFPGAQGQPCLQSFRLPWVVRTPSLCSHSLQPASKVPEDKAWL